MVMVYVLNQMKRRLPFPHIFVMRSVSFEPLRKIVMNKNSIWPVENSFLRQSLEVEWKLCH